MRVSDLIRAGGSLDEAAFGGEAELTRYEVVNGEARQTELVKIDLGAVRRGDEAANLVLRPYDYLTIKETPQWRDQETITISGEVRFPGIYPIQRGETLHAVLLRAGGLTDLAFPAGSVFTRAGLREREKKQIETLANRMQADLAGLALQSAQSGTQGAQALSVGQSLLADLRNSKPVGRLVVNLNTVLRSAPGAQGDLVLKNGDQLVIPRSTQEVTVLGEVQNATSHIYKPGLSRDDYVSLSGGATQRADHRHIYIVRADGSVVAGRGGWFRRTTGSVRAGDTIVVPLDAERMRPLPLWSAVTQIIYNIAIAAAAVHSF
jgi:protein involved in polysaccharide export with SLBB domain